MLDFLPLPVKAVIGVAVILFIAIRGFKLTNYKDSNSSKSSASSDNSSNKSSEEKK